MECIVAEVFHVTTVDNAEQCLVEGLVPYKATQAPPETLEKNHSYDKLRPESVAMLGVSRANSVYAHVDVQSAIKHHNGSWLSKFAGQLAYLAVDVDPLTTYVADMYLFGNTNGPRQYWGSLVPIKNYLDQLSQGINPTFGEQRGSSKHLHTCLYWWPEVLIPDGVEPARIRLMAASELPGTN